MRKGIILALVGSLIVIGILGGIKGLQIKRMIAQGEQFVPPPETVTVAEAETQSWESLLTAVGSLDAVQGVTLTAELAGKVVRIAFEPGSRVTAGELLLEQDIAAEAAQLRAAEAALALARINFERAADLRQKKTIPQSEYDSAQAQYRQAAAQVDGIRAVIRKKTIRAPFDGRLGIRLVNLGQVIDEGEPIVSLQSIDPIFVNFSLPQQELPRVAPGYTVRVMTDALPEQAIEGRITAVNAEVDDATRNIRVQATLANPGERLRPGMFVRVAVLMPAPRSVVVIPATAVLHAPYGDSVFVVADARAKDRRPAGKIVRQQFVRLGEGRGDFISVVSGLQAGEPVVSTGIFKLRNGQAVTVDNTLAPEFKLTPRPENS